MRVYVETYGCRMNICDSEVLLRLLSQHGYDYTEHLSEAEVVILNCCSVRAVGHERIWSRLEELNPLLRPDTTLCLVGCMATQMTEEVFDRCPRVQILADPTTYERLPQALERVRSGQTDHILLRQTDPKEVYDDVLPLRAIEDRQTAAVVIMKGCDRYCSYCIEPYTRGERVNRSYEAIMREVEQIRRDGYEEITLFGHIVDVWEGQRGGQTVGFAELLADIAEQCPQQRIKFISSHPLTFSDAIVRTIAAYPNIRHLVHWPVQSGDDEILKRMNRHYTAQQLLQRLREIRAVLPDMQFVSDIMVGFPGETEEQFRRTLHLIEQAHFADLNVFRFSMREGTLAHRLYADDVPEEEKEARMKRVNDCFGHHANTH